MNMYATNLLVYNRPQMTSTDETVVWRTTSCCADWSKHDHVTLVTIAPLHSWVRDSATRDMLHHATCFDNVPWLFPKLAEPTMQTK